MTNYLGLYNSTNFQGDEIITNTAYAETAYIDNLTIHALAISNDSNQITLGTNGITTISDVQASGNRTLTIPTTTGNASFVLTDNNNIIVGDNTFTGINSFSNAAGIKVDVINEYTSNAGVTIDSVLIKDGEVDGVDVSVLEDRSEHVYSTGLYDGGVLSIGSPNTTFSISDGEGLIVNNRTNPHTITNVSWTGKTNISVTNIATQLVTYITIDSTGSVIQSSSKPTNTNTRDYIFIGAVVHVNLTIVDAVNQEQQFILSPSNQLRDILEALGYINITGNTISASGANLQFSKSAGYILGFGINYSNDAKNPHKLLLPLVNTTSTDFQYRLQTGTNYNPTGPPYNLDPNFYDLAGVRTAVTANKFTIQRVYVFPSNKIKLQYGQTIYQTMAAAKEGLKLDAFVTEASITENGMLICYIIVKQGTTNLQTAANAYFLQSGKFDSTGTTSGGATLQLTYDNSVSPEILTDVTRGAVSIKRGTAADTDAVFEIQNAAGTNKFICTGEGVLTTGYTTGIIHSDVNGLLSSSTIVNADVSASAAIAYSKLNLANSILNADINTSAAIAYSKLNLANSILNADINTLAAIAYSKLNLANSILNADINTSAAVAYSKLNLASSIKASDINSQASTNGYVLTANGTGGASYLAASSIASQIAISDIGITSTYYYLNMSPAITGNNSLYGHALDVNGFLLKYRSVDGTLDMGGDIAKMNGRAEYVQSDSGGLDANLYVMMKNESSNVYQLKYSTNIKFNNNTGTLTCNTFTGALSGNATTATTATTATNSTNATIATDTTNADRYLTYVSATSGNNGIKADAGALFNPSTNKLTISGNITGDNMTCTNALTAGSLTVNSATITTDGNPIGAIIMFANMTSIPSGYRECDGASISRTTYATLYALIGTDYGVGDGTTTFTLPNLQGRFPLMYGSSSATGATTHSMATSTGEETHVMTTGKMVTHLHAAGGLVTTYAYKSTTNTGSASNQTGSSVQMYNSSAITGSTANTGSSTAMKMFGAHLVINFIIKVSLY